MSTKSKTDALLAAIQRKAPAQEVDETPVPSTKTAVNTEASERTKRKSSVPAKSSPRGRAGKPVQFWIHGEDGKILRELSAWVAGQGERTSDSLIIRSALRVAKTDSAFLKAYREAAQLDGRLKRHRDV